MQKCNLHQILNPNLDPANAVCFDGNVYPKQRYTLPYGKNGYAKNCPSCHVHTGEEPLAKCLNPASCKARS